MTMGCERCDFGWRWVQPEYAERVVPMPDLPVLDDRSSVAEIEHVEKVTSDVVIGRAGVTNSVYPCKVCQSDLFFRWAARHLDSKHNVGACSECMDLRKHRRSFERRGPKPIEATPRRDLENF